MPEARSERVDLRMSPAVKRTLQRAAAVSSKTLTEFLLDTGLNAAVDTLAGRRGNAVLLGPGRLPPYLLDREPVLADMTGCDRFARKMPEST